MSSRGRNFYLEGILQITSLKICEYHVATVFKCLHLSLFNFVGRLYDLVFFISFLFTQGFFVILSWMPIYFKTVRP